MEMESKKSIPAYHWLVFGLCVLVYLLSGTVSTLISVYLPVVVGDLLGDASEKRLSEVGPYINAAFLYGMMAGGLTLGLVSDRIGRIRSLAISAFLCGAFTWLIIFVQNWHWMVLFRFLSGVGVAGILLISTVLIAEVWQAETRAIVQGILSVAFPVGIVLSGGLNVYIASWRTAFWLGLIPVGAAVLIIVLLKESELWKEAREEGQATLRELFTPENRSHLIIGSLVYGSVLIGLWAIFSWTPTWVNTLLGTGVDGQQERGFTMMILGMGGILGSVLSGFLVNGIGLRRALLTAFAGCFVMCFILFLGNRTFSSFIYLECACLALFFGISQGALSVYIPELFQTVVRATATGFCFNIGRIFTATGVFFVGSMVSVMGGFGNALLLFSITFVIAFGVTFWDRSKHNSLI